MNYYVLACETGREEKNIRLLESTVKRLLPGAYVKGYSPVRESREFCARSWSMKLRPLIPGYVIVVSDSELWRIRKEIFMISDTCYGFLKNIDGTCELRGGDLAFAMWVEANGGHIRPSKIIIDENRFSPQDKVMIVSGPLKDLEGTITSIYKGVRVTVEVKVMNEVRRLTLPVEVVDRIPAVDEKKDSGRFVVRTLEDGEK